MDKDEVDFVLTVLRDVLSGAETAGADVTALTKRAGYAQTARRRFKSRQKRREILGRKFWNETCWDILLDLYLAHVDGIRVSVTDLATMSAIPIATAVRWVSVLAEDALIVRAPDPLDARRVWVSLGRRGVEKVELCLAAEAARLPHETGPATGMLTAAA